MSLQSSSNHGLADMLSAPGSEHRFTNRISNISAKVIFINIVQKVCFDQDPVVNTIYIIIGMMMANQIADALYELRIKPQTLQDFFRRSRPLLLLSLSATGSVFLFRRLYPNIMHICRRFQYSHGFFFHMLQFADQLCKRMYLDKMLDAFGISGEIIDHLQKKIIQHK